MMMLVELASKSAGTVRLKTGWKISNDKFKQKYRSSTSTTGRNISTNAVHDNTASNGSISQKIGNVNSKNLSTPAGQAEHYAKILKLGENGTQGLVSLAEGLSEGVDLGEAALAFNALYNQGKKGVAMIAAENASLLSPYQREMAYQAGVVDGILERSREKSSSEVLQNDAVDGKIDTTQLRRENSDGKERKVDNGGDGRRGSSKHAQEQVGEGSRGVQMADRNSSQSRVDTRAGGERVLGTDSEGIRVQVEILNRIADTAIVDEQGHPIAVYHATDANFDVFNKGDIGFHFGNTEQAAKRANDKKIDSPKYIRAYLNIKNPIVSTRDTMSWNTRATTLNLWSMGILTDSERAIIEKLDSNKADEYNSPAAIKLREILESKGYDGISYPNGFEGEGTSYIAFHDEQIVRVNDTLEAQSAKENAIGPERVVYSSGGAMAYDALFEDHLNTAQKKAVDVGKGIGIKVVVADTRSASGAEVDGFIGKDGTLYISKNNVSPVAFIFKHELAHFCERSGQKYQDFKNAVRKSAEFKNWLKQKGMTELEYNAQIRRERQEIGQGLDEPGATLEIIANFVGDVMFGDNNTLANDLIATLKPKERRSFKEFLRDFFDWIKSKFVGKNNVARTEIHKLEKMFGEAFRTAVNVQQRNGEQFAHNNTSKDDKRSNANFAEDKYYSRQIDKFETLKSGGYITVGKINEGSPLNKVGIPNGVVYFDVSKIVKEMKTRNDPVPPEVMKQIPAVLDSPVVITEYIDQYGMHSVNVYGNLYVASSPVVVGVMITQTQKGNIVSKIKTVHPNRDALKGITDNNILYLSENKKETKSWFQSLGKQTLPLGGKRFGFIRSISQSDEVVNHNNKKTFEEISDNGEEQFSYVSRSEATANARRAIEEFGVTGDFDMTGFVLEDGQMLKLSPYGLKGVNHSLIGKIYDDVKGSAAVNRFIQEGNVRIKASSPGIEIGAQIAPSVSQYNMISRFISRSLRSKGVFYLDITDASGNEVDSVFYDDRNSTEDVIYDIKDFYRNGRIRRNDTQFSYTSRKDSVDNYTEKQYNDFGWVRDNDVISAGYWKNFTENFAQAVAGKSIYPKTKNGEYMINVYDVYESDGISDVVVFASGTIESPNVTRIVKIDSNNSEEIDRARRNIYESARRGIQQEAGELFRFYNKADFVSIGYGKEKGSSGIGYNSRDGYRGRSSKTSKRIKELKINDDGSFVTVYSDGSVETTGPSDSNQYSYTSRQESVETIFERAKNGEISLDEAERQVQELLSKKGDDPIGIADLQPDDMNTTPRLNKRTKGKHGDGDSKFAESLHKSKIFNEDFKAEVKDDSFVKHYASITNKETLFCKKEIIFRDLSNALAFLPI